MDQKVSKNKKENKSTLSDTPLCPEANSLCNWLLFSCYPPLSSFFFKKCRFKSWLKMSRLRKCKSWMKKKTTLPDSTLNRKLTQCRGIKGITKPLNVLFRYSTSSISALLSSMTSERQFSCQTILQKSSVVSARGY